jgi:hypothetical protein
VSIAFINFYIHSHAHVRTRIYSPICRVSNGCSVGTILVAVGGGIVSHLLSAVVKHNFEVWMMILSFTAKL